MDPGWLSLLLSETPAPSSLAGIVTALAASITALGGLILAIGVLIPTLRETRKVVRATREVHTLVNQQHTDLVRYQNALVTALKRAGVDVPDDQSQPQPLPEG